MQTLFVSIKGRDYRWFKDAVARGDLPLVKATAAQLPAVNVLELTVAFCALARDSDRWEALLGRRVERRKG